MERLRDVGDAFGNLIGWVVIVGLIVWGVAAYDGPPTPSPGPCEVADDHWFGGRPDPHCDLFQRELTAIERGWDF